MAGPPDLFVVCKNCQAEVSPYITECPYCGHRLRKRAPKLEKGGTPKPDRRSRRRSKRASQPRLGRLRPGEMPGVRSAAEGKPVATMALTFIPALLTVLFIAGVFDAFDLLLAGAPVDDWWTPITTNFFYAATSFGGTGYEVLTLGTIFLFGWLLERRHGHWAPLLVFTIGTAAGMALVVLADAAPYALGANAGALGMLAAWSMRDLLAARRGEEIGGDLLGAACFAIVLVLMPAAVAEAHPLAGAGGGLAGLLAGAVLARVPER